LSVLVALILTPALCATMLKPIKHGHGEGGWFSGFFGWFNGMFERNTGRYQSRGRQGGQAGRRYLHHLRADRGGAGLLFMRMPTSFLPEEDQGVMFTQVHAACRRHPGAHHRGPQESRAPLPRRRKGHRELRSSPSPASASAAAARTWALASSICATGASGRDRA
jgi:hypothetical protein